MGKLNKLGYITLFRDVVIAPLLEYIILAITCGDFHLYAYALTYLKIRVAFLIATNTMIALFNPELLNHRAKGVAREDAKKWDKILLVFLVTSALGIVIVCGIEARPHVQNHHSPPMIYSEMWFYVALLSNVLSYVIFVYATISNPHFEPAVRIQKERAHKVITTGPYAYIRHPGYTSGFFGAFPIAILLQSKWAILPTLANYVVLLVRTYKEDDFLSRELKGYAAYQKQVKHRLFPGIW